MELWAAVSTGYSLRVDELFVLEAACREVDLIDLMDARVRAESLIAKGAYGQPIVAPLVPELRAHRATLASLLRQLKLPDEGGRPAARSASEAARHAANARWWRGDGA
jgi:hypothetical protein